MSEFKQKNYLICAGTSSIAEDLIRQLKEQGANIFFTSRSKEKADNLAKKYNLEYKICEDLADFSEVENIFKLVKEKFSQIDGVVNFSGSILIKAAHQVKDSEYDEVINKNLTTAFAVTRAAGKYMTNGGSVILMSSVAANIGIASHEAIAAAKAGIEAMVRSAACSYATKKLRFNAIAPSLTETNLSKMITGSEMMLKISNSMHALGRIGNIGDVSRACMFLLNPDNDWITGQVIRIEGGFLLKAKAHL